MTTATHQYEMTNTCTCLVWEDGVGYDNEIPTDYCYGTCWEDAVEDFTCATQTLFESNETGWWKVSDLRLWNGNVSGYFHATKIQDVIHGMTVNSAWTMRYTAYDDRVEYSLSHHDAMGSASVLTAVTEEQREELGLY